MVMKPKHQPALSKVWKTQWAVDKENRKQQYGASKSQIKHTHQKRQAFWGTQTEFWVVDSQRPPVYTCDHSAMAWGWGAGWPSMLTPCLLLTWPRGQPRELSHHLFLDYGMIRKSWRAEEANTLSLVLKKKKTKTIVLPMKWIDQLNFPVYKDIILKSHLSIHNHRDCGKGKPFQTNFTSVHDGQWDCNKDQTMDVELEEVHPSLCWLCGSLARGLPGHLPPRPP